MDFVTSDHHFEHGNIIKWRPDYDELLAMNLDLVRLWNESVSPEDTVYHLGDIVMGNRLESLEWIRKLNGNILLLPGNHDHVHKMFLDKKSDDWGAKWVNAYEDVGITVCKENIIGTLNGITYEMCHFPYEGDHTEEERYAEWRPERSKNIDVLLHGHIHDLWKAKGNQVNVGVDVWDFAPVPLHIALDTAA